MLAAITITKLIIFTIITFVFAVVICCCANMITFLNIFVAIYDNVIATLLVVIIAFVALATNVDYYVLFILAITTGQWTVFENSTFMHSSQ